MQNAGRVIQQEQLRDTGDASDGEEARSLKEWVMERIAHATLNAQRARTDLLEPVAVQAGENKSARLRGSCKKGLHISTERFKDVVVLFSLKDTLNREKAFRIT